MTDSNRLLHVTSHTECSDVLLKYVSVTIDAIYYTWSSASPIRIKDTGVHRASVSHLVPQFSALDAPRNQLGMMQRIHLRPIPRYPDTVSAACDPNSGGHKLPSGIDNKQPKLSCPGLS